MKKSTIKLVAFGMLVLMLLSIFTVPVKAETYEKVVLKKANKEFLIYYKDICNDEFEFAFSLDKSQPTDDLFTRSAKDQADEGALDVAYIDATLYDTYFATNKAYIWIKDNNDQMLVSADLVDLTDALNDGMIELVNNTTKRIDVDTTQTHETHEMVDGVDTTVTTGKVVVDEKGGAKYSYTLTRLTDTTTKANKLFDLAEALKEDISDTYTNLSLSKQFYDLYMELMPTNSEWTEVENSEILQPDNTVEGDKYIVYLKEETADSTTVDAKFLTCVYKADEGVDQKEETITETVKLPVTFDSGTILFIILGIIVLALVIFAIIRVKANKKDENK
ncbi:MAG: hypothetical protein ACI4VC_01640 [Clostridia bacterium]